LGIRDHGQANQNRAERDPTFVEHYGPQSEARVEQISAHLMSFVRRIAYGHRLNPGKGVVA
jgi:hypothetical protein